MSSRAEALSALQVILQTEVELHQSLLLQLQEEAVGFGVLTGSELLKIQRAKEKSVEQIIRQEEKRVALVNQFPQLWPEQTGPFVLSVIIRLAPASQATVLQQCFDQLQGLLAEIRNLAERNSLESSARLRSVEASLRFLAEGPGRQQATYSGSGEIQHSGSKVPRTSA